MDHKMNEKYFVAKGGGALFFAGLALVVVGLLVLFFVWELAAVGVVLAVVGLVLALLASGKKVKDSDIDDAIARQQKEFEEQFVDKFITDHSRSGGLKVSEDAPKPKRRGKPEYFGNYWFSEIKYAKRGGDGKYRSSVYCFTGLLVDPDQLSVGCSYTSLIEPKKDETWVQASFTDLAKAELADAPADAAYTQAKRYIMLRVTKKDGAVFAEVPMTADATADKMVAEINQAIGRFAQA